MSTMTIPRRDSFSVGPHRYRLACSNVKRLAYRFMRLGDRQLECLRDIISVYVLQRCKTIVRKVDSLSVSETLEHIATQISGGIDRIPSGTCLLYTSDAA